MANTKTCDVCGSTHKPDETYRMLVQQNASHVSVYSEVKLGIDICKICYNKLLHQLQKASDKLNAN